MSTPPNAQREEAVAGLSMVRDGRDILPYICGHYLRLGFNHLHFIDDGSTDGTLEFLTRLSQRDSRISVRRVETAYFEQSALMTDAANELIEKDYYLIFPFDQDEFWNIELRSIRRAARAIESGVFRAKWAHFVQDRSVLAPRLWSPLKAIYRAPILVKNKMTAAEERKPRLVFTMPKVGFKSQAPVSIEFGQHKLLSGPKKVIAADLELFHLPVRSAREIEWRKSIIPRLEKLVEKLAPEISKMATDEREALDELYLGPWEANSFDQDGCTVAEDGVAVTLIPDRRLRTLLMKAWMYIALRHPLLVLQ